MQGKRKFVVVVADDFGRSLSVNRAVAEAHEKGILTAASIMPGGEAFDDAVKIARSSPRLSVGLHLTLCDGNAVLPRYSVPDLVDADGCFRKSPSGAWIAYSRPSLLSQIDREIEAQFDRVNKAGIRLSHVDGHHHIHMQPSVFSLLCGHAARNGVHWVRVPREPLAQVFGSARGRILPLVEWVVFGILGFTHKKKISHYGLQAAESVYGLSRTGHLDEAYLLRTVNRIAGADRARGEDRIIEIFSHPDSGTPAGRKELLALTSRPVRDRMRCTGVTPAGYRELCEARGVRQAAGETS